MSNVRSRKSGRGRTVWGCMVLFIAVMALISFMSGCRPQSTGSTPEKPPATDKQSRITLGLLPVTDVLPFVVAEQKGYYDAEGVKAEIRYFNSAMDRDSAFQAGDIDGAVADILAAASMFKSPGVRIVSTCLGVTPEEGRFSILASPGANIRTPADLNGVEIAVSPNSIIEFATDSLLAEHGLKPSQIKKTIVADIPLRLQMLLNGQVKAATLPDPIAKLAETKGARLIVDDTRGQNLSQTVLVFSEKTLASKPKLVRRVMKAYARAVADVSSNPEQYRALMEEKLRLPKGLMEYRIERFSPPAVPTRDQVDRVLSWMAAKGILRERVSYEQLVTPEFVPGH